MGQGSRVVVSGAELAGQLARGDRAQYRYARAFAAELSGQVVWMVRITNPTTSSCSANSSVLSADTWTCTGGHPLSLVGRAWARVAHMSPVRVLT